MVLATRNRRDVLTATLDRLAALGLTAAPHEVIVVDNASTDGTPHAVAGRRRVSLIALPDNLGSCAKALGVERARGEFTLFLDDDSYPRPGCVEAMLERFRGDAALGAAGFTVHLPDGSQECSALPHVFVGCGVGFRTAALRQVGGLDRTFFMAAEEYDVAFRLLRAGWRVETFAELQVDHLKTPHARSSARLIYHDARNNLRLIARYLPRPYAAIYRRDWRRRYRWLAERAGHPEAFRAGWRAGRHVWGRERRAYRRWRLSPAVLEQVFSWHAIEDRMRALAATDRAAPRSARPGVRSVLLADWGKNVYAFVRGARRAGIEIVAIADDRFAADPPNRRCRCRRYRGTEIVSVAEGLSRPADACVISNTSYVHAELCRRDLARRTRLPVHAWFAWDSASFHSGLRERASDEPPRRTWNR